MILPRWFFCFLKIVAVTHWQKCQFNEERLLEGIEHDLLIYRIQLRCLAIGMPAGRGIRPGPPGGGGGDEDGRLDGASVTLGGGGLNKSESERENDGER